MAAKSGGYTPGGYTSGIRVPEVLPTVVPERYQKFISNVIPKLYQVVIPSCTRLILDIAAAWPILLKLVDSDGFELYSVCTLYSVNSK